MTLEDFFTMTELKDGLTTPTRVNDLLTIMQNQKENIVISVGDATQQWSAVANTIAATENKECLDLFIQLDGLRFIDKWLNEAQNLINDTGNGLLEELVIALLRALERLKVDQHQSVDSGVGLTVQGLLGHSSFVVREKAKDLCDRWIPVQNIDGTPTDVGSVDISPGVNISEENLEQPACSIIGQQETNKEETVTQEVMIESGTETIKVDNDKSKSESTLLMGTLAPLDDAKEMQEIKSLTTLSSSLEHTTLTSSTDVDHALEFATKTETMEDKSDKNAEVVDGGESQSTDHQVTKTVTNNTSGIGDSASGGGGLQDSPGAENPKLSSNSDSDEDEKRDIGIESDDYLGSHLTLPNTSVKSQKDDLISKRPSHMELDYGMVDPLELARQVAIEVELEVDSQEQSCSTSTNEKEHQSTGGLGNEVSSGPVPGPSSKGSSGAPESMNNSETLDNPTTENTKMEESALNSEKGVSGFDLNQEVSFDEVETDGLMDPLSTPISVVSASRVAASANGPPVALLQFEGTLGWKGSATTSAFRRIPEGEKTFSSSSSHSNSNQRLDRFEFDLNVSEVNEDKIQDFLSRDKVEEPSRLQLDLNSLGDSDASIITLGWKRDGQAASLKRNRPQSPSVSSSSMQPSFRNIDLNLNDHSTLSNNASFNNLFLGKLFNNKKDKSVISIFGTQVEVNHTDNVPSPKPNGRILEPSVDFNLGRPGSGLRLGSSMPYSNLPAYGYSHNGFTMGPMYAPPGAPIPYMVDSRGAPIMPSIPPTFSQPTKPFFFGMAPPGMPSNGAGPSRTTLDLNPGFITERGNREINNGGLRQFFNQNQASSSSVIGGKRAEPDCGWEFFPINYKHQQPPWQ